MEKKCLTCQVAFYFAFVDMAAFKRRLGIDFQERFSAEIKFVLENQLMEIKEDRIYLTERGSDYINGIIPLFYSEKSKEELKAASLKRGNNGKSDEELFLSSYKMMDYDRPSVTADVAAFTIRTEEDESWRKDNKSSKLAILLVRRGEHPYMNCWALPGGMCRLEVTNDAVTIVSKLIIKSNKFGKAKYEIIEADGLAFDHAAIIADALMELRSSVRNFDIIFDFLPEKFTLTALQRVQETIMNVSILPANFRRKIAEYVIETDEYTTGVGHRPAKLFIRK